MGLGAEFARQLAARGQNLLLTARSVDKLEALASELRQRHGVQVTTFGCDLADPAGPARLEAFVRDQSIEPSWLINNAGFGDSRPFTRLDHQRILDCVQVNVTALTDLTHRLLPLMRRVRGARILNVASVAGFQPVPYFACYAATKAYVLSLSEGLREELREVGISVTALCPGPTATEFATNNLTTRRMFHTNQSAELVVRRGIRGALAGKAIVVTQNRGMLLLQRVIPRAWVRWLAAWLLRTSLEPADRAP